MLKTKKRRHISMRQLFNCQSTSGLCIGLDIHINSSLVTHLSCKITRNGASFKICTMRSWPEPEDRNLFFEKLKKTRMGWSFKVVKWWNGRIACKPKECLYSYDKDGYGKTYCVDILLRGGQG
jgi:hypothetical protein